MKEIVGFNFEIIDLKVAKKISGYAGPKMPGGKYGQLIQGVLKQMAVLDRGKAFTFAPPREGGKPVEMPRKEREYLIATFNTFMRAAKHPWRVCYAPEQGCFVVMRLNNYTRRHPIRRAENAKRVSSGDAENRAQSSNTDQTGRRELDKRTAVDMGASAPRTPKRGRPPILR